MDVELSVVIPAYNEEANLRVLLPLLKKSLEENTARYEILVLDTTEPLDNTKKICVENNAVYVPREPDNLYGSAVRTAIARAQYKRILFMDSDGSHDPLYIRDLLEHAQNNDIVIGSRYMKGGHTDNNIILVFMSKILNLAYTFLFGLKIKDVSNSFRVYDTDKLKSLDLLCGNFDIIEEILIKMSLQHAPLRVAEVPITFKKRLHGKSKRSFIKFVCSYFATLFRLLKYKTDYSRG